MSTQPPSPRDRRERPGGDDASRWRTGGAAGDAWSAPPENQAPRAPGTPTGPGRWSPRPDAWAQAGQAPGVARPGDGSSAARPNSVAWAPASSPAGEAQDVAQAKTQPLRAVPARGRALADLPTTRMAAQRAPGLARASGWRAWLSRVALALGVMLLGVRAAAASASFMQPGGGILGWSVLPPTQPSLIIQPPPVTSAKHQLTPPEYALWMAQHMSLDDELGQMIMIQYYEGSVSPDLTKMIYSQHVGSALLLGRPVAPGDRDMSAQMQQMAGLPLLMAIDQEGGYVNRFASVAGPLPGAAQMQTTAVAQAQGAHDATLLRQYGFNLNLAPDVDVGTPNPVPQFVGRTFSENPAQVAALAGAYLQGLQQSGQVTGVPKHWPGGLVETGQDPHLQMPMLSRSQADWERIDVAPYRTLLATGDVRAIMVSHEMIPQVDPKLPTSLSPTVIDGVLRGELGFNGVVITDDFASMRAITDQWPLPQACMLAVKAGADIVAALATPGEVQDVKDALKQAMTSGVLTKARIDLSVQRILTLKIQMGLIPMPQSIPPRRRLPSDLGASPLGRFDDHMTWVQRMLQAA